MQQARPSTHRDLVEHFFRHENGRLVATLTRVLGSRRLDLIEDVAQAALVRALQSWSRQGVPNDPSAWLFRVAKNLALDALRREHTFAHVVAPANAAPVAVHEAFQDRVLFADEIPDDQLRMLFVCCDPEVPIESQLALALRTLCGFTPAEIARGLLTSEANIQKRIIRAKEKLREKELDVAFASDLFARVSAVHQVVYLLFNEGYSSLKEGQLVRSELCDEAIRLALMLADHPQGDTPATSALLALMFFHSARFPARADASGGLLLLEEQDRSLWDNARIRAGIEWLRRSAQGDVLSRFHLEAGVAAEHSLADSFESTNWRRIVELYDLLVQREPTAVHRLNRAIALAQVHGPEKALADLQRVDPSTIPPTYHLWDATLGELHRRAGNTEEAKRHLNRALALAPVERDRELLRRRLGMLRHA